MKLFSELYGRYYTAIGKILSRAHGEGISRGELDRMAAEHAFAESALHLAPQLSGGQWDLLEERAGRYRSKLAHASTALPLTHLQRAWLRALLNDRRIGLFVDPKRQRALQGELADVQPLYRPTDFVVFDAACDGDPYGDGDYVARFRRLSAAIRDETPLAATYRTAGGREVQLHILPQRLQYSQKDDKFRLTGLQRTKNGAKQVVLNLSRIVALDPSDRSAAEFAGARQAARQAVTLAISGERNALERCMLQFASYDKQTTFDEAQGRHICQIRYSAQEEAELLIRVLSFGPVVEVLEPEGFRAQVRRRVELQCRLNRAPV